MMAQPYVRIDRSDAGTLITAYAAHARGHRRVKQVFAVLPTPEEEAIAVQKVVDDSRARYSVSGMLSESQ